MSQYKSNTEVKSLHGENIRRDRIDNQLESLINNQINLELSANSFYRSLFAFFNRDDVAFPNVAKYFLNQTDDESLHANDWINYLNQRGGKVKISSIPAPKRDYYLLEAFELAIAFEKKVK